MSRSVSVNLLLVVSNTSDAPVAAEYRQIRAQFAGSRRPGLRTAGTGYVDLAVRLLTARGTDGYETVWFYQRLAAACEQLTAGTRA